MKYRYNHNLLEKYSLDIKHTFPYYRNNTDEVTNGCCLTGTISNSFAFKMIDMKGSIGIIPLLKPIDHTCDGNSYSGEHDTKFRIVEETKNKQHDEEVMLIEERSTITEGTETGSGSLGGGGGDSCFISYSVIISSNVNIRIDREKYKSTMRNLSNTRSTSSSSNFHTTISVLQLYDDNNTNSSTIPSFKNNNNTMLIGMFIITNTLFLFLILLFV